MEKGREVHPWFFEEEGGLRPRSRTRQQIREEGSEVHPMFFEEEGGLCPRSRKGGTDLGRRKGIHPWFFEEEGGFCVQILRRRKKDICIVLSFAYDGCMMDLGDRN